MTHAGPIVDVLAQMGSVADGKLCALAFCLSAHLAKKYVEHVRTYRQDLGRNLSSGLLMSSSLKEITQLCKQPICCPGWDRLRIP